MTGKTFTSPKGDFTLKLPVEWEEYDDGEESTFAFFNSKSWTGNLRITPLSWTAPEGTDNPKAAEFIEDELTQNEGAVRLKLDRFDCAHFKKDVDQDGDKWVMYYWIIGKENNLFICSLTIDKEQEQEARNKDVLETVQNIIKSIK
jgi:hypothetical protein